MKITMHGNPLTLVGTPIKTGETAPVFYGINQQMQPVSLKEFAGKVVVISSFPSIDTPVCSAQMHHFNKMASELSQDVVILAISCDLPFALHRYCAAEGIDRVITLSDYKETDFGKKYGFLIERVTEAEMPTKYGIFKAYGYVNKINGEHHIALVKGDIADGEPVLCRVHSECLTGDAFGSLRCDCGEQLAEALRRIEKKGRGVLLYMRQEGRGIGLINKLKAYHLQDGGMDTVEANLALGFKADLREYGTGAEILADLGVKKMILMTNNPLKIKGLDGFGLEVVGREPIEMTCNEKNEFYMYTKYKKMGHILHVRNDWKKEE